MKRGTATVNQAELAAAIEDDLSTDVREVDRKRW
jgi:hypothetical protein